MPYRKYSPDIKLLAVRWSKESLSHMELCSRLGVDISKRSVTRWTELYHSTRAVVRDPALYMMRGAPGLLTSEERGFLEEILEQDPTVYIDEAQEALYAKTGKWLAHATVWNVLHEQLNLTLKTARTIHAMQSPARRGQYIAKMADIRPECLVFVDESGVSVKEVRRSRAWAIVGCRTSRLVCPVIQGTRYNVITSMAMTGTVGTLIKELSVKRKHFKWFLKNRLLPFMNPYPAVNSVLVLDNAKIHKGKSIPKMCADAGVKLVFLPAYSPDLNPIEKGFSIFKSHLRRHNIMESEDVVDDLYEVVEAVFTASLGNKLFHGAGYV